MRKAVLTCLIIKIPLSLGHCKGKNKRVAITLKSRSVLTAYRLGALGYWSSLPYTPGPCVAFLEVC